ncbi:hypothetical protein [Pediococcus pentosaceus]
MDLLKAKELNSQNIAILEVLESGFNVIKENDNKLITSTTRKQLEAVAEDYSLFIDRISKIVSHMVDTCMDMDSFLGYNAEDINELKARDERLDRLLKVLQGRLAPEQANIPEGNLQADNFIIEQDSLLMVVEELLSGNVDDFEKDVADFELEASV